MEVDIRFTCLCTTRLIFSRSYYSWLIMFATFTINDFIFDSLVYLIFVLLGHLPVLFQNILSGLSEKESVPSRTPYLHTLLRLLERHQKPIPPLSQIRLLIRNLRNRQIMRLWASRIRRLPRSFWKNLGHVLQSVPGELLQPTFHVFLNHIFYPVCVIFQDPSCHKL